LSTSKISVDNLIYVLQESYLPLRICADEFNTLMEPQIV